MTHFYPGFHPGFHNSYQLLEVFPTYVGSATTTWQNNTSNTRAINVPAGAAGDRLLAIVWTYGSGSTPSTPSGWSSVGTGSQGSGNVAKRSRAITTITQNPSATTFNISNIGTDDNFSVSFCLRFRNSAGVAGSFAAVDQDFGGTNSFNPPNLDIGVVRKQIWIAWMCSGTVDTPSSAPSNFSGLITGGGGAFVSGDARAAHARRTLEASALNPGPFGTSSSSAPDRGIVGTLGVLGSFMPQ